MSRLAAVWCAIVDFVVGDDWWLAVGVVLAIGLAAVAAAAGIAAWWIPPVVVAVALTASLWRSIRPPAG